MRTTGKKAFTLVELLIVIIIIGILATLVVPSLIRAVTLAKQAACKSAVKELITGLNAYASAAPDSGMPKVPTSNWNTSIGTNRTVSPFDLQNDGTPPAAKPRNHSSNLWLLARRGYVPLTGFICASTDDLASTHQKVDRYWDFSSSRYLSYGIQSPYGYNGSLSVLAPDGVVLIADGSPYVQGPTGTSPGKIKTGANLTIIDWSGGASGINKMRLGNSPNHEGAGQNIGFKDGRSIWSTSAACGKSGDNIYTARNERVRDEDENTKYGAGSLSASSRNNPNDTLILP